MTFNQHGQAMLDICETQIKSDETPGPVARELALSRTHLEDALTRYNSAQYRKAGTWKRADPDAPGA